MLDRCKSDSDAVVVLMRESRTWPQVAQRRDPATPLCAHTLCTAPIPPSAPQTIMGLAWEGQHKHFIGHRFVSTLVDERWRGVSLTSHWALSPRTG